LQQKATHELFFSSQALYILVWDMANSIPIIMKPSSLDDDDQGDFLMYSPTNLTLNLLPKTIIFPHNYPILWLNKVTSRSIMTVLMTKMNTSSRMWKGGERYGRCE
jgi:hypothetical protein